MVWSSNSFQDVAFLPTRVSFCTIFLKIVVDVKASGLSHVLRLCLGKQGYATLAYPNIGYATLVKYSLFYKSSLCVSLRF